jgi:Sir2 family
MDLDEFATQVKNSRAIVFFTGAGISTESGVPDFRSPGGVWTKYQPVLFQDFLASEAARIQHWQLKKATYELFKTVKPNIAHYAICQFEQRGRLLGLITQNIDGAASIMLLSTSMKTWARNLPRPLATFAAAFSSPPTFPSGNRCLLSPCSAPKPGASKRICSSSSVHPYRFNQQPRSRSLPNEAARSSPSSTAIRLRWMIWRISFTMAPSETFFVSSR